jgi:A/G-specific adenine glycosylase
MDFSIRIMNWYRKHRRDLPWRQTRDPFKIWLSEVILQQTRVQQGLPYYEKFTRQYRDVKELAAAPEPEVMRLWQGLGYYSRARNLHAAAKTIASQYDGIFPPTYAGLLQLKGIGDYTAAAIASIAYGEVQPVVDGNVYRVLSRIFGIETPIDSTAGKKEFRALAGEFISRDHPADFNQAVMEFGAIQCVPQSPDCSVCPFVQECVARKKGMIASLPVKSKKTKITDRYFYYLILRHEGHLYMKRRTGKDIWQGLHDFPLIETKKKLTEKQLMNASEWKSVLGKSKFSIRLFSPEKKHVLSHQNLHARFVEIDLKAKLPASVAGEWMYIKEKELKKHAVPVLIEKYFSR